MKESDAWLILAEEHDAVRSHHTDSPYLCDCIDSPEWDTEAKVIAAIPLKVRTSMKERIKRDLKGQYAAYDNLGYNFQYSKEARQARVLACLMFGEQAKDEERST